MSYYLPFSESGLIITMSWAGPEESLGKIFVMKQSEMMMMMNVWGLALGYQGDRLSNVVNVG